MADPPFPVGGTIFDTDGATALGEATVTLQNTRTLDKSTFVSDSTDGSYVFDLGETDDFPNGYTAGDELIFYVRKEISQMVVKYVKDTAIVAGDTLEKNLTVLRYIKDTVVPFAGMDWREINVNAYDPHSRAQRIVPVTPDGVRYYFIGKRTSATTWDLVLPGGTKFGEIDANGSFKITGGFYAGQTF